ncbi:MAG: SpoIIE family protein phosphatase [Spirochaetales bacterium]|nr:SpoIIE family protein phosphatase [Spirochaetales bacterium]
MTTFEIIAKAMTPFFVKAFISLTIYLYSTYIRDRKVLPALNIFRVIVLILLLRDLVFSGMSILLELFSIQAFIDQLSILALSDVLIILAYLSWVRKYTGKRKSDVIIYFLNLGILVLFALNIFLFKLFMDYFNYFYFGWVVLNSIILIAIMYGISEFNTEDATIIIAVRNVITTVFLLEPLFMYTFFSGKSVNVFIIQTILLPLSYFLHIFILYKYNIMLDQEERNKYNFITNDLESLFEFMRVLGGAIAEKLSLDKILTYIISSAVKTTSASAGAILMIDEYDDVLKVEAVSGFFPPVYAVPDRVKLKISSCEAYFASTPIPIGDTVLGQVAKSGEPVFVRNTMDDERMKNNILNDTLYISSIMIIPLVIAKRVLGVLSIIQRESGKMFSESDYFHLKTFAEYASLTIDFILTYMELLEKKEMEREIGIAAEIQQKLLPKRLLKMKNAKLVAYSVPAKGVSGDYYDVFNLKGNKIALVICDVAGKGVPAALVMVMVRSILHLIASSDRDISTILTWVNRGISGQVDIDHYATMCMLSYDEASQEVVYSNAAHHPLLVYRKKTKSIEYIDTEGLPIGIERTTRYGQKRLKLNSGDIIALYTDGIIEAMNTNGEQYTLERFSDVLIKNSDLAPNQIIDIIKENINAFVGNAKQHDDQTLLMMKIN